MSASSESEVDGFLLIETLAREQGLYDLEDSHGASSWLVPVDPTMIPKMVIPGADHHKVQVVEVDGEVDPKLKTSAEYVVQLPSPDRNEEIVLTPPLAPEGVHRFSKRNARSMQENVEARAVRVANEKDGAGNKPNLNKNSFAALSDNELMIRAAKMGVCIPDNDFTYIDVLRELEIVRGNLEEKKSIEDNRQGDEDDIIVTNGLGKKAHVNLDWLEHDETINEQCSAGRSNKKKQCRSAVKLSRPVTRSQKRKDPIGDDVCNPTLPPGRVIRTQHHKKRSK
ncbi:uncharacterized protein LOC125517114 isoform X1 [Triticum urartu]|uniref:uncharacterized protein LOC125517114 isoform X1 n=1 Tax=Triticum urartu TaxID=4572 RepID=UPI0020446F2C|nr:uncharacterized protein LOC125517114 isoform X1 [Triticum urartu]XP_048538259.1 uncharacterized protein LOC125517114 isoform X1 [Triticum urartu]